MNKNIAITAGTAFVIVGAIIALIAVVEMITMGAIIGHVITIFIGAFIAGIGLNAFIYPLFEDKPWENGDTYA